MKNSALTIFALFLILLSAPLLAQTENPEDSQSVEATATAGAELSADVNVDDQDEAVEASAEAEVDGEVDEEEELPQTASPLALLALLGAAGVGSAFGVRSLRRQA